jgi:hypothetical protein
MTAAEILTLTRTHDIDMYMQSDQFALNAQIGECFMAKQVQTLG